jgi:hypothetical protein
MINIDEIMNNMIVSQMKNDFKKKMGREPTQEEISDLSIKTQKFLSRTIYKNGKISTRKMLGLLRNPKKIEEEVIKMLGEEDGETEV